MGKPEDILRPQVIASEMAQKAVKLDNLQDRVAMSVHDQSVTILEREVPQLEILKLVSHVQRFTDKDGENRHAFDETSKISFDESRNPGRKQRPLLPLSSSHPTYPKENSYALMLIVLVALLFAATMLSVSEPVFPRPINGLQSFYSVVKKHSDLCLGENGRGVSQSGYIGLEGDSEERPKRSFFWLFEAQNDSKNAPIILTIGGGPGTSGILNPMAGQSHCLITANGSTVPNPNAWSERFNLLALDHPIGVGFSYGTMVNNSRSAAIDVYDFLQKFFVLFPHLSKNQFVIASGSYGGTYVPHIATVIHERNRALSQGKGQPGAIHINLESVMVSNAYSDALSHYRWSLHQSCYNTHLYNATTCNELYYILPSCLESIQFAYENPSNENRVSALTLCSKLRMGDTNGTMLENVKKQCDGTVEGCFPQFLWLFNFLNSTTTRSTLGVPQDIWYKPLSEEVGEEFVSTGDLIQQAHLMYEPLLESGIRVLHYVGKLDCNCGWPGILSFLKLLRTPFQERFINAPDLSWPSEEIATVRAIGNGAGNMTLILMAEAGHMVVMDQPALVKNIVEHWVENREFV